MVMSFDAVQHQPIEMWKSSAKEYTREHKPVNFCSNQTFSKYNEGEMGWNTTGV